MRFERLKAKGLGPFKDEIDVDFTSIDGKLVAVTGSNGAGKSSMLELLAGALFRQCPTRGSLSDLATTRDAFVEVEVVNGQRYRVRQTIDAVSKKGETVIVDAENRPVVASGKVREADHYIAKHLTPPSVLYASTFAAQGSGQFLDLSVGERKACLLRILGIERLESLAEKAREHVRETKAALATLDARIADERARARDPVQVEAELEALKQQRADLEESLSRAKEALVELSAQEEQAKAAHRAAEDVVRRRGEIQGRLDGARSRLTDVTKRLTNNEGLIAQRDEIRVAEHEAKELDEALAGLVEDIGQARTAEATANQARASARDALADVSARASRAADRKKRLEARVLDRVAIERAAAAAPDLRAAVAAEEAAVSAIEEAIGQATAITISDAATRVTNLRAPLRAIARGVPEPDSVAKAALIADDFAAEQAIEVPKKLAEDRRTLDAARAALSTKRRELASVEKTAARASELATVDAEIAAVATEIAGLEEEATKARAVFDAASDHAALKGTELNAMEAKRRDIEIERAKIDPLVKLGERLMQAEVRIAELSPQAASARSEIVELEAQLAALPAPSELPRLPDVDGARRLVDSVEAQLRSAEAKIAVKTAQHSDAIASASRLDQLEADRRKHDEELADWTRLADDLGRDGLQAAEIDAAGPELTELVNDLLRSCVGSRWTVMIEATRLSSDGKRQLEGCEVRVIDTERGRDGAAESLSGGERVIVGEAVSLALSMLACRRSGVQGASLIRDESGAALDPVNGRRYVSMLRRAAELVGASKVLFVSHSAELAEMADARIEVRDGHVRRVA